MAKRGRPSDPVTRYARAVTRGRVLVGRAVRLACARHLADLERPGFVYRFEPARANRVGEFFARFLCLDDGAPFLLLPWQQFVLGSLLGWVDAEGARRFQTAYVETAKGTGKTPIAAGLGLYGLIADEEQAAEVYSLGVTRDQAAYLFRYAHKMASRSSDLRRLLGDGIGQHNLAWLATHSYFRPLSSEGRSLDNKRPHFALIDELHEHRSPVVVDKMRLGVKGRTQPVIFEITNAGFDHTSVCWNHHDYSLKVLEGIITDDRWFAYVCQLDPCESCQAQGFTQPNEGCTDCDDWTDEQVWAKVNPSLGVTVTADYYRNVVHEAQGMPAKQAMVKRLNFCCWTQAQQTWIPADSWEACRRPAAELMQPTFGPSTVGIDLSEKLDLTACVVARRIMDPPGVSPEALEVTELEGEREVRKPLTLNFSVALSAYFWLPEETLRDRVQHERIPYDVWRQQGWLRVTPGAVIDHDLIYEQIMAELVPKVRPARIGYDPHNATQFAVSLRDRGKQSIVEVPQGRKLSETFKWFEALVRARRIWHDGNPILAWCVANCEPHYDRYRNLWVEKASATKRIDGAIAAVIALSQLMVLPLPRRSSGVARVWTPEGFRPLVDDSSRGGARV